MKRTDLDSSFLVFTQPNERERWALALVAVIVAALLASTLQQTLEYGHGDAQVYFRAGWAIWAGYPLYQVSDHHGWFYVYPPPFAFLMEPFADPLPGYANPAWALPYPLALAAWFAVGVCALAAATHMLANAIARSSGFSPNATSITPFWASRLGPPLALAVFVGSGWERGQPTTILLLLIVMFLAFLCKRRPLAASIALSVAITIKIYPAALLLIPILRRDVRVVAYTAVSVLVFLFVFPILAVGFHATGELYQAFWAERLRDLVSGDFDSRIADSFSPWSITVVGFGSLLARVFATPVLEAPNRLPAWAEYSQLAFDIFIPLAIAAVGHRRFWRLRGPQPFAPYAILTAGALLSAALPAMLTVARPHYWALQMPLVAILFTEGWRRTGSPRPSGAQITWVVAAAVAFIVAGPSAPGILSRLGSTTIVMLLAIVAGLTALRRLPADAFPPIERREAV